MTVPASGRDERTPTGAVTILVAGDVMLGRGVAPVAAADASGLFERVRQVVRSADLALANLESPLTTRPHESPNPFALEADPATASLLSGAGFDVVSLANNHAGDAGAESVLDTVDAVHSAGMGAVGAGANDDQATAPYLTSVHGVRVAVVAFDATGAGMRAGADPGVAPWEPEAARRIVQGAAAQSDVLIVSIHGGVEYLPESDPRMVRIASRLVEWGADVVWGHGPHVVQPIATAPSAGGRTAVVATSVGNLLFDQQGAATDRGALLEVLADRSGVLAYRIGTTADADLRVGFDGWTLPAGDAALIDGEWWELLRHPTPVHDPAPNVETFPWGTVVSASSGHVTGPARLETVVSFRHRPGPHPVRDGLPDLTWTDRSGRSVHLGIYEAHGWTPLWVAGMVPAPVADVVACDGAVALGFSTLDDPTVVATGAARWRPFGLDPAERLPGGGQPACADIDGDGSTEPVVLDRKGATT